MINDMGGRPEHKDMRQMNYKKTDIIILCYSMCDRGKSLARIEDYWIKQDLDEFAPSLCVPSSMDKDGTLDDTAQKPEDDDTFNEDKKVKKTFTRNAWNDDEDDDDNLNNDTLN